MCVCVCVVVCVNAMGMLKPKFPSLMNGSVWTGQMASITPAGNLVMWMDNAMETTVCSDALGWVYRSPHYRCGD